MPNTARSVPSGNGGSSGVPGTKCFSGPRGFSSRPGSASSGAGMVVLFPSRRSSTALSLRSEQRQVGLSLAAEHGKIYLRACDPARLRERPRLGLDHLGRQHPAAAAVAGRLVDPLEVAAELLDGVDRADSLDLHRHVLLVAVKAHQVDRADVRGELAPDEPQSLAAALRALGQQFLEVDLGALLLERRRLAHVVLDVAQHLDYPDVEPVLGGAGPP